MYLAQHPSADTAAECLNGVQIPPKPTNEFDMRLSAGFSVSPDRGQIGDTFTLTQATQPNNPVFTLTGYQEGRPIFSRGGYLDIHFVNYGNLVDYSPKGTSEVEVSTKIPFVRWQPTHLLNFPSTSAGNNSPTGAIPGGGTYTMAFQASRSTQGWEQIDGSVGGGTSRRNYYVVPKVLEVNSPSPVFTRPERVLPWQTLSALNPQFKVISHTLNTTVVATASSGTVDPANDTSIANEANKTFTVQNPDPGRLDFHVQGQNEDKCPLVKQSGSTNVYAVKINPEKPTLKSGEGEVTPIQISLPGGENLRDYFANKNLAVSIYDSTGNQRSDFEYSTDNTTFTSSSSYKFLINPTDLKQTIYLRKKAQAESSNANSDPSLYLKISVPDGDDYFIMEVVHAQPTVEIQTPESQKEDLQFDPFKESEKTLANQDKTQGFNWERLLNFGKRAFAAGLTTKWTKFLRVDTPFTVPININVPPGQQYTAEVSLNVEGPSAIDWLEFGTPSDPGVITDIAPTKLTWKNVPLDGDKERVKTLTVKLKVPKAAFNPDDPKASALVRFSAFVNAEPRVGAKIQIQSRPVTLNFINLGQVNIQAEAVEHAVKRHEGDSSDFTPLNVDPSEPIYPGDTLRYQLTYANHSSQAILNPSDILVIARLSENQAPTNEIPKHGSYDKDRHAYVWKLSDLTESSSIPAGYQTTVSYTATIKLKIAWTTTRLGTQALLFEPAETQARFASKLVYTDLYHHLALDVQDYFGQGLPGVFVDVLKEKRDTSLLKDQENYTQSQFHVQVDAGPEQLLGTDGLFYISLKRHDIVTDDKGKVRFLVVMANHDENMAFRTATYQTGDILHVRTKPIELSDDGDDEFNFKFSQNELDKTAITADQWEFPDRNSDRDTFDQTLMASVIWHNVFKAKMLLNDDPDFKYLDLGVSRKNILGVNFLPRGTEYSYYIPHDKAIYLSASAWRVRGKNSYSPHTELHEFGHWLLDAMGLERTVAHAPLSTSQTQTKLPVPHFGQPVPGQCGQTSVQEVIEYFKRETQRLADTQTTLPNLADYPDAACPTTELLEELQSGVNSAWATHSLTTNSPQYFAVHWNTSGIIDQVDRPAYQPVQSSAIGRSGAEVMRQSLRNGAPVIYYNNFYGRHIMALVGYEPKDGLFYAHDTAAGSVQPFTTSVEGVPLTAENLMAHAGHPEVSGWFLAYLKDEPIFGGTRYFQGNDSAHYGYVNDSSNNSLIEGTAIYLAVNFAQKLGFQSNNENNDWLYKREDGSVRYNLRQINPAFVSFGPLYPRIANPDSSGEGWVVASLLKAFQTGLNGVSIGGKDNLYPWLQTASLASHSFSLPSTSFYSIVKVLHGLADKENEVTVADLRDELVATNKSSESMQSIGQAGATQFKTTTVDLGFGLFGFFLDRARGNWKLDAADFESDTSTSGLRKLGRAANGDTTVAKIPQISYPTITYTARADFPKIPSTAFARAVDSRTNLGDTYSYQNRNVGTSLSATIPVRPQRRQPLDRPGSVIIVRSDVPEVTLEVNVLVNEPMQNLAYSYQQTVSTNEPVSLSLPYQTYGSLAVIRIKDSTDWLTIDSSQYWTLLGSDNPPVTLAEKNARLGGATPSLEAVLAATGYGLDGRKLVPSGLLIQPVIKPPANPPTASTATPAPIGQRPMPSLAIGQMDNKPATGTTASNPVKSGETLRVSLSGLQGEATVTIAGQAVKKAPMIGDAQTLNITIPSDTPSGAQKLSVTDSVGNHLEIPIFVTSTRPLNRIVWIMLALLFLIALIWHIMRRGGSHFSKGGMTHA